ncbi:hypothetical protein ACFL2B_01575 [Patescibacteria group bacterium]
MAKIWLFRCPRCGDTVTFARDLPRGWVRCDHCGFSENVFERKYTCFCSGQATHFTRETPSMVRCHDCGNEWYENYCWHCAKNGYKTRVSTRKHDPCKTCGWYICERCGKCQKKDCPNPTPDKARRERDYQKGVRKAKEFWATKEQDEYRRLSDLEFDDFLSKEQGRQQEYDCKTQRLIPLDSLEF